VANIAFGLVDFTSSAVNFGFELDNGSTSEIHTSEYRNTAPTVGDAPIDRRRIESRRKLT
jgi:hypothetical protein